MCDGVKAPPGLDRGMIARLTLPQVLHMQAERLGKKSVALREKAYGIWQPYTWHDYAEYVKNTALGLIAVGLKRGDRIGIITNNHVEWLFSELGGQAAGAVTLNLFTTAVAEELVHSLNRVSATHVIVQDQEQADKILDSRKKLPHVRRVIYIDPTGMRYYRSDPWLLSFRELLEIGRAYDSENGGRFVEELNKGRSQEVAVMIQTSGTTGIPKIAMLSHRNFTAIAEKWLEAEQLLAGMNWISITPPAWIVDQMWGVGVALLGGMTMNFPETPETVAEDFREIGPDVIITSSRFWEDLASKIRVKMADAGWMKRTFLPPLHESAVR